MSHRIAAVLVGLVALSIWTPASAAHAAKATTAASVARVVVRDGGQRKEHALYRLLADHQQTRISEKTFSRCFAPKGSENTGTHVIRVRRVVHRNLRVFGYANKQPGAIVLMKIADRGGKHKRNFNGALISESGHWHWYLRERDIHRCNAG